MFTGLVTDVGTIVRASASGAGRELRVSCAYSDLTVGESIALDGACLTVTECGERWFAVAAIGTTLGRTTIGGWVAGRRVNLERALRKSDRLGGHFVLGHVDGIAHVEAVRQDGDARLVDLSLPPALAQLVVPHGSIAVDGVSLTVNAMHDPTGVQLSLIEHTLRNTTLGGLDAGDRVHVEADVIGKYVQRLMAGAPAGAAAQDSL
ncbi:MAG: riboflavin synthase [Gemmatimonadaceae bacterium]|nr:riboflavin synthase [Gemmatimonadaceae bacterium]